MSKALLEAWNGGDVIASKKVEDSLKALAVSGDHDAMVTLSWFHYNLAIPNPKGSNPHMKEAYFWSARLADAGHPMGWYVQALIAKSCEDYSEAKRMINKAWMAGFPHHKVSSFKQQLRPY